MNPKRLEHSLIEMEVLSWIQKSDFIIENKKAIGCSHFGARLESLDQSMQFMHWALGAMRLDDRVWLGRI
jgi:hypothetical protein